MASGTGPSGASPARCSPLPADASGRCPPELGKPLEPFLPLDLPLASSGLRIAAVNDVEPIHKSCTMHLPSTGDARIVDKDKELGQLAHEDCDQSLGPTSQYRGPGPRPLLKGSRRIRGCNASCLCPSLPRKSWLQRSDQRVVAPAESLSHPHRRNSKVAEVLWAED